MDWNAQDEAKKKTAGFLLKTITESTSRIARSSPTLDRASKIALFDVGLKSTYEVLSEMNGSREIFPNLKSLDTLINTGSQNIITGAMFNNTFTPTPMPLEAQDFFNISSTFGVGELKVTRSDFLRQAYLLRYNSETVGNIAANFELFDLGNRTIGKSYNTQNLSDVVKYIEDGALYYKSFVDIHPQLWLPPVSAEDIPNVPTFYLPSVSSSIVRAVTDESFVETNLNLIFRMTKRSPELANQLLNEIYIKGGKLFGYSSLLFGCSTREELLERLRLMPDPDMPTPEPAPEPAGYSYTTKFLLGALSVFVAVGSVLILDTLFPLNSGPYIG